MIAEGEDALGLGDLRVLARSSARKSDSAIGVTYSCEKRTSVRAKKRVARLHRGDAELAGLARRRSTCAARIFSQSVIGRARRRDRGRRDLAREARLVVREEPAVLDDRRR